VDRVTFRWFDRTGKPAGDLAVQNDASYGRISPDGRQLASHRFHPEHGATEIWVTDLVRGVETRLTNHPAADEEPQWSPDGRQIAFNSDRPGLYGAFIVPANGSSEAREVLGPLSGGDLWIRGWSPDGKTLLIESSHPKTNADILVAPADDPRRVTPYLVTDAVEENPSFSPDGKWIAYTSNASGRREVYVQSYPRSDLRYQVSTRGGGTPVWTPDGGELIFESAGTVAAVSIARRGTELEPGVPRTLFKLPPNAVIGEDGASIRISADGQKLLLPVYIDGRKPVELHVIATR
jgi:Tol biopolymer transport system component